MKRLVPCLAWMLTALIASSATGQTVPALGHTDALITQILTAGTHLKLLSPAFHNRGDIPFENTQYRGNHFPGLSWSRGPTGTKSYMVVMQGAPERAGAKTSIHLTLYNIPAIVGSLDQDMTEPPAGAVYGPNVHGLTAPYAGPHTHTLAKQAYHLQVLALDCLLPVVPDQDFDAILSAARGHVLAEGDLIGYAGMDPQSPEAAKLRAEKR